MIASLFVVVILGMSIPLVVVLNSRMDDESGVIAPLLIPTDWACIALLLKITISNTISDAKRFLKLIFNAAFLVAALPFAYSPIRTIVCFFNSILF